MMSGTTVTASVERIASALPTITQPVTETTVIARLTLRAFRGGRVIFAPMTAQFALDMFGVAPAQATQVVADWDPTWTAAFPIQPGDILVYQTARYFIHGVQPYPGMHVLLLVSRTLTQS